MSITTQQVSERLLKKSQGVAETNYPLGVRGIGEESIGTYNLVLSEDIWVQSSLIPLDAPSLLDNEESGVVKYYDKLQLKVVDGGTNVSFISENGELKDCISGKFGFSYIPKIFNTNGDIQIYHGSWMVDYESGVLTFYDINDPEIEAVVNSSNPPLISFYKYIGKKGVDINNTEITLTGLTINGDLTVNGNTLVNNITGGTFVNINGSGDKYMMSNGTLAKEYTEIVTQNIDGINKIFTLSRIFISGSVSVYLNGIKERYATELDNNKIQFQDAPKNSGFVDLIEVTYLSTE